MFLDEEAELTGLPLDPLNCHSLDVFASLNTQMSFS
jgi:hypothetical protein